VRAPGGAGAPAQRPVEVRPPLHVFPPFPEPPEWHHFDLEVEGPPAPRAAQQMEIPNPPEYALFPADFAPLAAAVAGQREERIGPPPPLLFAEPGNLLPFVGFDDEIGDMLGLGTSLLSRQSSDSTYDYIACMLFDEYMWDC
jgi:hypothetical protein